MHKKYVVDDYAYNAGAMENRNGPGASVLAFRRSIPTD